MSKHILALYGKGSCGKTTTLRELANLLEYYYGSPISGKDLENRATSDFSAVYSVRGKTVVVATSGDAGEIVLSNCEFIASVDFDIAIVATRTSGDTCVQLCNFCTAQGVELKFIHKHYEDESSFQSLVNNHQADELLRMTLARI